MIIITIDPPELKNNEKHIKTEVQVADNDTFGTPIFSEVSTTPILRKQIPLQLIPNKRYYVKARFIFEPGGLQGFSNTLSFIAGDTNDIKIHLESPTTLPAPIITSPLPNTDRPVIGNLFTANTLTDTMSYTWVLTDIQGNVEDIVKDDNDGNTYTHEGVLKTGTSYVVRCLRKNTNGDTSQLGSYVFNTAPYSDKFHIIDAKNDFIDGKLNKITTTQSPQYSKTEITIIKDGMILKTFTSVGPVVNMYTQVPNGNYTVKAVEVYTDGKRSPVDYLYVNTKSVTCGLPASFPVVLGCDKDVKDGTTTVPQFI